MTRLRRATAAVRACTLASCAVLSVTILAVVVPAPVLGAGCPNEALRVGPSASLPDCRAYEQVTPVAKNSGTLEPVELGVGPDGTASVISSSATALAGNGELIGLPGGWYSTARTAGGWVTSAMPPPASEVEVSLIAGGIDPWLGEASLDGRGSVWSGRANGQPEDAAGLFVARVPGPLVEEVGPVAPPGTPANFQANIVTLGLRLRVAGVSADLSHVLFQLKPVISEGYRLWPFDATAVPASQEGPISLYEYLGTHNSEPLLVGVDDSGKLISTCDTWLGDTSGSGADHNALSLDGGTAFFTAHACGSAPGTSPPVDELFARIDNGEPDAHTVAISEPTSADCAACDTAGNVLAPARFADASTDGSKVFFTTTQPLLGEDRSTNIYEYDFAAAAGERVVRVSAGDGTAPVSGAEVQGIVRSSEDGSHVYFVAKGALTSHPNSQGQRALQGANNFYVFERDARYPAGHLAFIAALSSADANLWKLEKEADVTPDGRYLVFTSVTGHLTPDDTSTGTQVFEYDAQSEALVRVSIGQDGFNHDGNTDVAEPLTSIAWKPFYNGDQNPVTYWSGLTMSVDGSYVFFQSSIGLTPQAIDHQQIGELNGEPEYAVNIYEYHAGNVYLISDGRDTGERVVKLAGTDASGGDVFFTATDRLAPQDDDSNVDTYDARIGGGFYVPPVRAECVADGCQGRLSGAPVLLSPGSELQAGGEQGNLLSSAPAPAPVPVAVRPKAKSKPAKCRRGFVKRHGRCVKRKAKKSALPRKRGG